MISCAACDSRRLDSVISLISEWYLEWLMTLWYREGLLLLFSRASKWLAHDHVEKMWQFRPEPWFPDDCSVPYMQGQSFCEAWRSDVTLARAVGISTSCACDFMPFLPHGRSPLLMQMACTPSAPCQLLLGPHVLYKCVCCTERDSYISWLFQTAVESGSEPT